MRNAVNAILLILALSCPVLAAGSHEHPERWYQERRCAPRGQMEVVLADGSRCDCLTEAIGQALNHAAQTGKRPGIVLILEREGDERYMERIRTVDRAFGLGVTVWTVDRAGREK